jgi:hypothetical protein
MANIKYTSIEPGFTFEHDGVKLKAVNSENSLSCTGCYFNKDICKSKFSCSSKTNDNKIVNLIFKVAKK